MRAQISLEYVFLVGAVLLVTIPLFFYGISEATNKIRVNQADDAVSTLANAADTVYSLGPGSRKYVWISIPSGVRSTDVNNSEIAISLGIFGGASDLHRSTKAVIVGSVPKSKGTYRIAVEALDAGIVRIGDEYNDTTPPVILRTYPFTLSDQFVCPGFTTMGGDTDEPATCKYDTINTNYDNMANIFDGRGITHTVSLYTQPDSNYTYYTVCMDTFGNKMATPSSIFWSTSGPCGAPGTGNYTPNGSDDVGPPEVHIIMPSNNSILNFSWVDFFYNVSDTNNSILYCQVQAEGTKDDGSAAAYSTVQLNVSQNITVNATLVIDLGNFSWYVNCTDDSTNFNTGQSEIWFFRMNRTMSESFLNSCAGVCGFAGYRDGNCRQNSAQCSVNNEVYYPSGDSKCEASSTGDHCCCVPY